MYDSKQDDIKSILAILEISDAAINIYKIFNDKFDGDWRAEDIAREALTPVSETHIALEELVNKGAAEKLDEDRYVLLTREEILESYGGMEGLRTRKSTDIVTKYEPKPKVKEVPPRQQYPVMIIISKMKEGEKLTESELKTMQPYLSVLSCLANTPYGFKSKQIQKRVDTNPRSMLNHLIKGELVDFENTRYKLTTVGKSCFELYNQKPI
jgi:hypothetical protein